MSSNKVIIKHPTITELRDFQKTVFKTFAVTNNLSLMVARQHGKTAGGGLILVDFAFRFRGRKNPHALVAMNSYDQVQVVYWNQFWETVKHLPEHLYTIRKSGSHGLITFIMKRPWFGDSVTVEFVGTGNLTPLKGRTCDLVILDEYAFMNKKALSEIFEPMTSEVGGSMLITSTINGNNHFVRLMEANEELQKDPRNLCAHLDWTIETAGLRSERERQLVEKKYKLRGDHHTFLREYMNDRMAEDPTFAPYAMMMSLKKKEDKGIKFKKQPGGIKNYRGHTIAVTVDVGKPGNNPAWEWINARNQVYLTGYRDDDQGNKAMLVRLHREYPYVKRINVYFPNDINQPAFNEGVSRLVDLRRFLTKYGLNKRIKLFDLPKVKNKKDFILSSLPWVQNCHFDFEACVKGCEKLAGTRFPEIMKTGEPNVTTFLDNGCQHAADAFCYINACIENGWGTHHTESAIYRMDDELYTITKELHEQPKDYFNGAGKRYY